MNQIILLIRDNEPYEGLLNLIAASQNADIFTGIEVKAVDNIPEQQILNLNLKANLMEEQELILKLAEETSYCYTTNFTKRLAYQKGRIAKEMKPITVPFIPKRILVNVRTNC